MVFGTFRSRDLFDLRSKPKPTLQQPDRTATYSPTLSHSSARLGPYSAAHNPPSNFTSRARSGSATGRSINSGRSATTAVMGPSSSPHNPSHRPHGRRERNVIDMPCAFCEEPIQHTLAGERVLHFTCSHVGHEECLYETVRETETAICPLCDAAISLDLTRGGSVHDIDKLAQAVRSVQAHSKPNTKPHSRIDSRWEKQPNFTGGNMPTFDKTFQSNRSHLSRVDSTDVDSRTNRSFGTFASRNGGVAVPNYSTLPENPMQSHIQSRSPILPSEQRSARGDCDARSIDSSAHATTPARNIIKNPIPAPTVTIRSEFPTITNLPVAQNITCIVSVVVPTGWKPDPSDLVGPPTSASLSSPSHQPSAAVSIQSFPDNNNTNNNAFASRSPTLNSSENGPPAPAQDLDKVAEAMLSRVQDWHHLDTLGFGKLLLYGSIQVGKDHDHWQNLDCYLFTKMLICIKDRRTRPTLENGWESVRSGSALLKGSILIQRHLMSVEVTNQGPEPVLSLSLSVPTLPIFLLKFSSMDQLLEWQKVLVLTCNLHSPAGTNYDLDQSGTDEDDARPSANRRTSSINSSACARSYNTAPTTYSAVQSTSVPEYKPARSIHVPIDIVVVVPVSSSMQGLKISLLRDTLRFIVSSLGDRDRMGLVTFGSSNGSEPLVGLSSHFWPGWPKVLDGLRPMGQKNLRADVVDGTNVAMNLLMQRRVSNPVSAILLISDSSSADQDGIDFVVSRAEAALVGVHSFGLGLTHKPDTMIELSHRTKAPYTYVKDWMMLRESVAGCIGSLQASSHQNAKLRLRIPEGSPVKFIKIGGALQVTKRASGRDAEACLGDLSFGNRRDILVHLSVLPDAPTEQGMSVQDPWESLVSGLEALGSPDGTKDGDGSHGRHLSVDELPLLQADLVFGDFLLGGAVSNLPRPTLLTVPRIPPSGPSPARLIPPNSAVVHRRMELLTSDMLSRALNLASRGQHDRAYHLLMQTRACIAGLGNGSLSSVISPAPAMPTTQSDLSTPIGAGLGFSFPPPLPGSSSSQSNDESSSLPAFPTMSAHGGSSSVTSPTIQIPQTLPLPSISTTSGVIDAAVMTALDAELAAPVEWIIHPAVFGRDTRKAVLQSIDVISSQRSYTFHTAIEEMCASRVESIKACVGMSKRWKEEDEGIREEM